MIAAEAFCGAARAAGFGLTTGVPCSYLTALIDHVIEASSRGAGRYVGATDEGSAVAIASGAEVGGARAMVLMQSSGLGNAVSPLTSLSAVLEIPALLVVTLRGEPGGPPDEPQHALMGAITGDLLATMRIPSEPFPTEDAAIEGVLARAVHHMNAKRTPYALVMKKGSVRPGPPSTRPLAHPVPPAVEQARWPEEHPSRRAMLAAVRAAAGSSDVLIATTGHTGRELHALGDAPDQLYLVGSMGCASSFGLGLALAAPWCRVVVLDGDGAALMRLGALATLGHERPDNLVHVVLDNEAHDSTGGQATASGGVDLAQIARACGYPRVARATTAAELGQLVSSGTWELTFVHAKIRSGARQPGGDDLPRPTVAPRDVAERLRALVRARRPQ
jgi:phosphonopyruvate decarboxylase